MVIKIKKKMICIWLISIFLLSSIQFSSASILAVKKLNDVDFGHELDQDFTPDEDKGYYKNYKLGQSFITSYNYLTKIKVKINVEIDLPYDQYDQSAIQLSIHELIDGVIGPTLSKAKVPYSRAGDGNTRWVEFDFPNVEVDNGKTYFMKLGRTENNYGKVGWIYHKYGGYNEGDAYAYNLVEFERLKIKPSLFEKPEYVDFIFQTFGSNTLNDGPTKPDINCEKEYIRNQPFEVSIKNLTHNQNMDVYYYIDQNWLSPYDDYYAPDYGSEKWIGPFSSGDYDQTITINLEGKMGHVSIRVIARDKTGELSSWSERIIIGPKAKGTNTKSKTPLGYNNDETGTVEGYIFWGQDNLPDGAIPGGRAISKEILIYREKSYNSAILIYTGIESRSDDNGYFKVEGIPIGKTYLSGKPWVYYVKSNYHWRTGFIRHHLSAQSGSFTMAEGDPTVIHRNLTLNQYTYDSKTTSKLCISILDNFPILYHMLQRILNL